MAIINKEKFFILLFLTILPFAIFCEEKQLKVTVSSEKSIFNVGDKVEISITLENVSSKFVSLDLPAIFIPQDYYVEFVLLDSSGNKVKFIGPELKAMWTNKTITLLNYYKFTKHSELNKYFPLNKGKYKFSVVYDTTPSKIYEIKVDILRVVSNTFEFEIK